MSWAYCAPKSTTRTVSSKAPGYPSPTADAMRARPPAPLAGVGLSGSGLGSGGDLGERLGPGDVDVGGAAVAPHLDLEGERPAVELGLVDLEADDVGPLGSQVAGGVGEADPRLGQGRPLHGL